VPRRLVVCAFAVACGLAVVFFHQGPSGNGTSRMLTVFALVEEHHLAGDHFQQLTQDKALVDGHFYSDKAPLSSYIVVPFYWLYRAVWPRPYSPACVDALNHLAVVVAAALPFALFAALLWWRAARERRGDAVWIALATAFSSYVVIYGSSYFGHVLAGTFFLLSYALTVDCDKDFYLAGFFSGCAVATEYPLFIAVLSLMGWLVLQRWRDPQHAGNRARSLAQLLAPFVVGALPPALLFFAHNKAVTGHYLELPYSHVVDAWKEMQTAYGIRLPSAYAFVSLLFAPYRGLLFYTPLLLLMAPLLWQQKRRFSLWLLLGYLLFNSTYYMWTGGWCTGPRHLTAATMLCLYEGVGAYARQPRHRRLFFALAAAGAIINLASAATTPLPPQRVDFPFAQTVIPDLVHGRINSHNLVTEWLHVAPHSWFLLLWIALLLAIGLAFTRALDAPLRDPWPE
jgi:hypothetical protein